MLPGVCGGGGFVDVGGRMDFTDILHLKNSTFDIESTSHTLLCHLYNSPERWVGIIMHMVCLWGACVCVCVS